jgi:hypothetical protein
LPLEVLGKSKSWPLSAIEQVSRAADLRRHLHTPTFGHTKVPGRHFDKPLQQYQQQ